MTKVKFFSVCTLCIFLMCTTLVFAFDKQTITDRTELVRQYENPSRSTSPARDEDDFMTFRYVMSSDGGETWSEPMGTGDTGMWEDGDDPESAWGGASYDFGVIVDNDNMLHFVSPLTAFNPDNNPLERVDGLYDIVPDGEGGGTYTLIAAQPEGGSFTWGDVGKDADGTLYVVWVNMIDPEEGDAHSELWAAKSTDDGWSDGFLIADNLDMTHNYPHMTSDVGEFFYVLYENPNVETGMFDHMVAEVPASLSGEANIMDVGVASPIFFSYYIGSVSAIAQDVNDGYVYFAVRNEDVSATAVGNYNGEEWTIESIEGAQRYPSMMMQMDEEFGGTPWVFSNVGPPAGGEMHHNWYSYDGLGYNGGDWTGQNEIQSILYEGGKFLLYCHTGVVTTDGRIVSGTNVWGAFTPDQFQTVYSDDNGESWSEPQTLWSIYGDGDTFRGGFIAQNSMVTGMDGTIYVAFCGQYGASDFDPPMIDDEVTLESFDLGGDWTVTANIIDFDEVSDVVYADINWTLDAPDAEERAWDYVPNNEPADGDLDERGYGTYSFTMPSDSMFGEALEDGDEVWFFVFAADEVDQYGFGIEHKIIVGQEFVSVQQPELVPTKVSLGQNYPNPFNNETVIPFSLENATDVNLSIFDINGRLIENLVSGQVAAGNHTVAWKGVGASTGVYFYIMEAAGQRHVAKLTLLR